jgi:23S rRNA (adenine2503-C2)-methyltransferase
MWMQMQTMCPMSEQRHMQILRSKLDASVNFVEQQLTGFLESRYVRRSPNYFVAYLSSQTGCNRGCGMCHLTVTGQTQFKNADLTDFLTQYDTILKHYAQEAPAPVVHLAWMARGEPLANPTVTETSTQLLMALAERSQEHGLIPKFNMSTIMPKTMRKELVQCFPVITPTIYYSMYSVNPTFRDKWLPGAQNVHQALDQLAEYQYVTKKIIKIHGAFISGENDDLTDVSHMMHEVTRRGIRAEFNIVRYNPWSESQGVESTHLDAIHSLISEHMPCKMITRVGSDVSASCGTFVS